MAPKSNNIWKYSRIMGPVLAGLKRSLSDWRSVAAQRLYCSLISRDSIGVLQITPSSEMLFWQNLLFSQMKIMIDSSHRNKIKSSQGRVDGSSQDWITGSRLGHRVSQSESQPCRLLRDRSQRLS